MEAINDSLVVSYLFRLLTGAGFSFMLPGIVSVRVCCRVRMLTSYQGILFCQTR